jgi:hypothetical protein
MPKPIDLAGQRIPGTRLTVIGLAPRELWPKCRTGKSWTKRAWICQCDCGNVTGPVITTHLVGKNSNTKSCGCLQRDKIRMQGIKNTQATLPKVCRHCRATFHGTCKQLFCSTRCKLDFDLAPREKWNCEYCGKPIKARKGQRYCCPRCKWLAVSKPTMTPGAVVSASHRLHERTKKEPNEPNE